jgi:hypothetical protein
MDLRDKAKETVRAVDNFENSPQAKNSFIGLFPSV